MSQASTLASITLYPSVTKTYGAGPGPSTTETVIDHSTPVEATTPVAPIGGYNTTSVYVAPTGAVPTTSIEASPTLFTGGAVATAVPMALGLVGMMLAF